MRGCFHLQRVRIVFRTILLLGLLSLAGNAAIGSVPNAELHVTPEAIDSRCCWSFELRQRWGMPGNMTRIVARIITPGVTVASASNVTWTLPAPSYTAGSTTITWTTPTAAGLNPSEYVEACVNNNAGVPGFTVIFTGYDSAGNTSDLQSDTITLECRPNTPPNDTCLTDRIELNTAWSDATGSIGSIGSYSTSWNVIQDPSPLTGEPRPSSVVSNYPGWGGPLPNSRWISGHQNVGESASGDYTFERCFCVREGAQGLRLVLDVFADNQAEIYLNNCLLGKTIAGTAFKNPPSHFDLDISECVVPGKNSLRIKVLNTSGPVGLDVSGYITAGGRWLEQPQCCGPEGAIIGTKYWDKNCNGKRDAGEPGLPNWTIRLGNNVAAITDNSGNYYFNNVIPGSYQVREVHQPGWTQSAPSSGTYTVSLLPHQIKENLDFGNCKGCFGIASSAIYCTPKGYQLCMTVNNQSSFVAQYFTVALTSPAITVAPAGISLGAGLAPNGISAPYCFILSGANATPGMTVKFLVRLCDKEQRICCTDTFSVKLPPCPPPANCCGSFVKRFSQVSHSASSNGVTSINGTLSAGPSPMVKVTATIVKSTINGVPVQGRFILSNQITPFSIGTITAPPYDDEVRWGPSGPLNIYLPATTFNLRIKFPGMAWNKWQDLLQYSIRFTFTDKECRTCDTVLHFTRFRYKWFFVANELDRRLENVTGVKDDDRRIQSMGEAGIEGKLHGNDSGSIRVIFPTFPQELGSGRFTGVTITPEEAELVNASASDSAYAFTITDGIASGEFSATPGMELAIGLKYRDLGGRRALRHRVALRYLLDAMPEDTLEEEATITLREEGITGGDTLKRQPSGLKGVRTFALHLENSNSSKEPISRLALRTEGGARIIAVGPTSNDSMVVLELDSAVSEADRGSVLIEPGGSRSPIYVTVTGAIDDSVRLHYTTLDAEGEPISHGDVTLSSPLTSAGLDEEHEDVMTGVALHQSYPNPSAHSATISFTLPSAMSHITLIVTDATGREVTRLLDDATLNGGDHAVLVDTDRLASGTYYYTLRGESFSQTRGMQVVR